MKDKIFLFKYFLYKKTAIDFCKSLAYSQFYEEDRSAQDTFNKFISLFNFAFNNSPYYRSKYLEAGLTPQLIKSIDDIKNIPILTKQEVKNNFQKMLTVSPDHNNLVKCATGGSTGIPMPYYHNKKLPLEAFAWRYLSWWGLKPWDNGAYIWRMTRKGKLSNLINQFAWWPVRKIRLDAASLDKNTFDKFIFKLNKFKPKLLQGYIGAVYEFALYLNERNIKINSPKAIWVTSAPVSEFQRELIEKVFNAPLYDEYGSSEVPWIAAQCNIKNHLHINTEGRYLEIVNKNNNGLGDIVVTDLLNYDFPLIRYELNDRTRFIEQPCNCGRTLPLIEAVKGRSGEVIQIPGIGKIDPSYLTTIFDDHINSIRAFQIIQYKDFSITLKIVPNYTYQNWKIEVEKVYNELVSKVKGKINVNLQECKEIRSDRGKTRYIISEIN
ncbi:MAG: phenylacetate--CoA ligase family protein [Ignavibacterium sp.]|nr:phenylacetate--CoA ligase family protein [Ignavibacterium sp.]